MEMISIEKELRENSYPGRGIIIGKSADGTKAVTAYFIMGRSSNSRNRVFVEEGEGIRTEAFDPSKMEDPSLIIYAPVRVLGNKTIVTNGDQTDTIYEGMDRQLTFEQSLRSREFEPDGPNFTPRISGIMHVEKGDVILADDRIVTSNTSTKYLPGILVGIVREMSVDANNLTQSGTLVPVVDFRHLDSVLIITTLKEDTSGEDTP